MSISDPNASVRIQPEDGRLLGVVEETCTRVWSPPCEGHLCSLRRKSAVFRMSDGVPWKEEALSLMIDHFLSWSKCSQPRSFDLQWLPHDALGWSTNRVALLWAVTRYRSDKVRSSADEVSVQTASSPGAWRERDPGCCPPPQLDCLACTGRRGASMCAAVMAL